MLILHLSDIHFRSDDVNRPDDPNLGMRDDLLQDVRNMRIEIGNPVDCVIISGDIAFSGKQEEYEFAYDWLAEICDAADCKMENVFVVPGNHDVDRSLTKAPVHIAARQSLRETNPRDADAEITKHLREELSADILFKPIRNFNRFAAKFLCEIGPFDEKTGQNTFAVRDFDLNDGSILRVWGFNSVLICDEQDDIQKMYVDPSAAQVLRREDNVSHLVVCHHPFGWLRNAANFRERIEAVAKIHLFGHEHTRRVEETRHFTRIRAGAVQPDRDEPDWRPGYNFIGISVSGDSSERRMNISLWVRQRDGANFIPIPDSDQKYPWIVEHSLPEWPGPQIKVPEPIVVENADDCEQELCGEMSPTPSIRSVALKMLELKEFEQRKVILELKLDQDGDQNLLDYEFALAAIKRAEQQGVLAKLDEAIEALNREEKTNE